MKELVEKELIEDIYRELIKKKNFIVHGEIEGLIVGIEEFFYDLETGQKEIISPPKRFGLPILLFDSHFPKDVKLFLEYLGYFNEGSMKMIVYYRGKKCMVIENNDGDEILVERHNTEQNVK